MKILSADKYWQLYAFVGFAKEKMKEVSVFEKLCLDILGKSSRLTDVIFDTETTFTRDKFNELLAENGFEIDWKGTLVNGNTENKKE